MQTTRQYFSWSRRLGALALGFGLLTAGPASAAVFNADFNGDGRDDLIVGAPSEDIGGIKNAGAVSVYYGPIGGGTPQHWHQNVSGLSGGAEPNDRFGLAVAVGDFDGDGYDDAAIGVPYEDRTGGLIDTGGVHILYGSSVGFRNDASHNQVLSRASYFGTNRGGYQFGESLAAGDFNGDGFDDLAVGVPGHSTPSAVGAGAVMVFFGDSGGLGCSPLSRCTAFGQYQITVPGAAEVSDQFGEILLAHDLDDDGYDDLVVGIPYEDIQTHKGNQVNAGAVTVFYGYAGGIGFSRATLLVDGGAVERHSGFGWSLAAGDFDGDGYPDLAVGHPLEPVDGKAEAGAVSVIFGDSGGLPTHGRRQVWHQGRAHVPGDPETGDTFGWSLAAADFDTDGINDLAIGIPKEDIRGTVFTKFDAGAVLVLYGSFGGLYVGADEVHPSNFNEETFTFVYDVTKTVIGEDEISVGLSTGDEFGRALSVMDYDARGYPDLLIGTPGENGTGAVFIINNYGQFTTRRGFKLRQGSNRSVPPGRPEEQDFFGQVLP